MTACSDFHDCCQELTIDASRCSPLDSCIVEEIEIIETICNGDGSYTLSAAYNLNIDTDSDITVFVNGIGYEITPNSNSIFTIEGIIPRPQSDYDVITLCVDEYPNCCKILEYRNNICSEICEITSINIDSLICQANGSYTLLASYEIVNGDNDFIDITINNNTFSNENTGTIFIDSIIPSPNSDVDFLEICLNDNPSCCREIDFIQPSCEPTECTIQSLNIENINCNEDSTYNLEVNFSLNIVEDADISVNVNGIDFEAEQTANNYFFINGITPRLQSEFDIITLCVDGFPTCCTSLEYDVSTCTNPCEIELIEIDSLECRPDGTYNLLATYDVLNSDSDFINVTINNVWFGTFENTGSIVVDSIVPRNNSDYDIIEICLNSNSGCCSEIEFLQTDCGPLDCTIESLDILELTCNPNGTFNLSAEYLVDTSNTFGLEAEINGVNYPIEFDANSRFTISEINPSNNSNNGTLTFCAIGNISCCIDVEFVIPTCIAEPCEFTFVEIDSLGCLQNGTYGLRIDYELINETNNTVIEASVNNRPFESFGNNGFLFLNNITPRTNSDNDIIIICVRDKPDTCVELEYSPPADCIPDECIIETFEIRNTTCNGNGTYDLTAFFDVNIFTGSSITVKINGIGYTPEVDTNSTFTITGITPRPQNDYDIISICINDFTNCCSVLEYRNNICSDLSCEVEFIEIESIACLETGNYDLRASYSIANADNDFVDVFINNEDVQFYENSGTLFLENITPHTYSDYDYLKICLNDNPECCMETEFLRTCDDSTDECTINNLEILDTECISDSLYNLKIAFESNIVTPIELTSYINGVEIAMSSILNQMPIQINDLPMNDTISTNILTICIDNTDSECCAETNFDQPNCEPNSVDRSLLEGLVIYPNPVNDLLYIKDIPQEIVGISIIDHLGRMVDRQSVSQNISLDVSTYLNGVYMIQFFTADNRIMSRRFVKM